MSDATKDAGTFKPVAEALVVGSFDVTLQLTQTRSIRMSGHVYNLDTPEDINRRLDIAQDAIERQAVRCDITNKEAQKDALTAAMRQHREHVASLVERKSDAEKTGKRLNAQERQQVEKLDADLRNFTAQFESLDAAIAKGKSKLNGAHAP